MNFFRADPSTWHIWSGLSGKNRSIILQPPAVESGILPEFTDKIDPSVIRGCAQLPPLIPRAGFTPAAAPPCRGVISKTNSGKFAQERGDQKGSLMRQSSRRSGPRPCRSAARVRNDISPKNFPPGLSRSPCPLPINNNYLREHENISARSPLER